MARWLLNEPATIHTNGSTLKTATIARIAHSVRLTDRFSSGKMRVVALVFPECRPETVKDVDPVLLPVRTPLERD